MHLLALLLGALARPPAQLPPAPVRLWTVRWQKQLVMPTALEWKARETGGPVVDPLGGRVVVGTRDGWLRSFTPEGVVAWELDLVVRFDAPPRVEGRSPIRGRAGERQAPLEV